MESKEGRGDEGMSPPRKLAQWMAEARGLKADAQRLDRWAERMTAQQENLERLWTPWAASRAQGGSAAGPPADLDPALGEPAIRFSPRKVWSGSGAGRSARPQPGYEASQAKAEPGREQRPPATAEPGRQQGSPPAAGPGGALAGAPQDGWATAGLAELARRIRARELSPRELVEAYLRRAEQQRELNAFIALFAEEAREAAALAEKRLSGGGWIGPLHGVPIAVKDLMAIRGYAMTGGSRALVGVSGPAPEDAEAVARLREAGAIILGATNLHEFAYGITSENPHFGFVRNPNLRTHNAGGSSGGSAAAVAAGLCAGALGTDTGGSIRIPASACGVVGLKPTYGRVSRSGVFPLAWTLDHVGPIGRTVEDVALLYTTLSGAEPITRPMLARGVRGLRIGRPRQHFFERLDPAVAGAVNAALARLEEEGARVVEVSIPEVEYAPAAQFAIISSEATTVHAARLREQPELLGEDVRLRLEMGFFVQAVDYLQGQRVRRRVVEGFSRAFETVDVLVTPTLPVLPQPLGTTSVAVGGVEMPIQAAYTRLTGPFNLTGLPAVSVPCGWSPEGLPIGLQVAAPPMEEARALQVAAVIAG